MQPDHHFPMNRWYVNRWLFNASAQDFSTAVQSMHEAMEHMNRRKYDLKITFYRAADPAALKFPDAPAPDQIIETIDNVRAIKPRVWDNAHRVQAEITVRPESADVLAIPPLMNHATVTARWPDARRIDFEVQPKDQGREISRFILDNNFTLWTRGYDFN